MQPFKHILQYLRAARNQQAYTLPEGLHAHMLAATVAEAQFYSLNSLHDLLSKACQHSHIQYEYKYEYVYERGMGEQKLQQLHSEGWEMWQCTTYQNFLIIILRRDK